MVLAPVSLNRAVAVDPLLVAVKQICWPIDPTTVKPDV